MKESRPAFVSCAIVASCAAILLSAGPSAADPLFGVDVQGSAYTRAGIQTFGNVQGPELNPVPGVAPISFVSTAACCAGTAAAGLAEASSNLAGVASFGRLSGSAAASAINLEPVYFSGLVYNSSAGAGVDLQWTDHLTVNGSSPGDSVTVRMTLMLEDAIGTDPQALAPSYMKTASVFATLNAASGTDEESGNPRMVGRSLSDTSYGPMASPQMVQFEFDEIVGTAFEVNGFLNVGASVIVQSGVGYGGTSGWSFADASHTMRGFFDLVNPTSDQRLISASGYDYSFSGGSTNPVPEPETYAMLLAGLGLLGFFARRRKLQEAAAA